MHQQIAAIVRQSRKRIGLSQKQLADLAGIGKTSVFDIESGKETVKLSTLLKVLETLNISIELKAPYIDERDETSTD